MEGSARFVARSHGPERLRYSENSTVAVTTNLTVWKSDNSCSNLKKNTLEELHGVHEEENLPAVVHSVNLGCA